MFFQASYNKPAYGFFQIKNKDFLFKKLAKLKRFEKEIIE